MLIAYLVFLPAMVLHWKLNGGACVLNNLENWLRYRRWRAPERNPEEGAWLRTLIANLTGIALTRRRDGHRHICRHDPVLAAGAGVISSIFKGLEGLFFPPT